MRAFVLIVLTIVVGSSFAQSGQKNFIDQPYVEVTGKAEIEIVPDEIYLAIKVSESDDKSKTSLEAKEKEMLKVLQQIGIDVKKDFAIKDFASNINSYWIKKSDIVAEKEYQLIVHDANTLGKVYVGLEGIGISNIRIERVDHSKMDDFRKDVKIKAIKAGKEKATYLAEAIDQSIGLALYINEMDRGVYRAPMMANAEMMVRNSSAQSKSSPQIEFKKIKLESSVQIRFELK